MVSISDVDGGALHFVVTLSSEMWFQLGEEQQA